MVSSGQKIQQSNNDRRSTKDRELSLLNNINNLKKIDISSITGLLVNNPNINHYQRVNRRHESMIKVKNKQKRIKVQNYQNMNEAIEEDQLKDKLVESELKLIELNRNE